MSDPLTSAAHRLGVATHRSAGPGSATHSRRIWATWPRHPLKVAHELLDEVRALEHEAAIMPEDGAGRWRACLHDWSYVGTFPDAVAMLALQVARQRRDAVTSRRPAAQ